MIKHVITTKHSCGVQSLNFPTAQLTDHAGPADSGTKFGPYGNAATFPQHRPVFACALLVYIEQALYRLPHCLKPDTPSTLTCRHCEYSSVSKTCQPWSKLLALDLWCAAAGMTEKITASTALLQCPLSLVEAGSPGLIWCLRRHIRDI